MERYQKITILHSNDLHGDFLAQEVDENLVGGVSMLSGYINRARKEEQNVLYCIAGDMFRGSVIDSEYQGLSTIEIMNMLAPDVVTIGNHETDYGLAHLLFIEKCANFPIINANLHITMNDARLFKPYQIINIGGMKVLFIGIITEDVIANAKNNGIISSFINIDDAVKEIGRICNTFNTVDIDFTVLLTHIGFEEDKKLAEKLDPSWGVDIIIGGHSHTFLDEPAVVNNIPIVQAGTGTDQIGRFDIVVDTDNNCIESYEWKTIPINEDSCPKDPKIEKLINSMKAKTDLKYDRVICRLARDLYHPTRIKQTSLGGFYCDALKNATGLDVFLLQSGAIRVEKLDSIVTYRDIVESFPYTDPLYALKVSGKQLRKMLMYTYRDDTWNGNHTEFYQLSSGLRVTYNKKKHEITNFKFHDKDITDDMYFSLGLTSYHYENFDTCFGFKIDEIIENAKPRKVATNDQDVLCEILADSHDISDSVEERLIIEEE